MDTKNCLLRMLEEHKGEFVSGEEIASSLGVSRAAVWKAVESLRQDGVTVISQQGMGYKIEQKSDFLREGTLRAYIEEEYMAQVFNKVESTNTIAKSWAVEGAPHGSVVVASEQTVGRGRLGRRFESPQGGLYMSVVLRPLDMDIQDAIMVTAAASVVVCRVVENLLGISLGIKWVNDLFYNDKKCCGILTEAGTGFETGTIEYIVVGIGINVNTALEKLTGTAKGVATSLFPLGGTPVSSACLAGAIHKGLLEEFKNIGKKGFLEEYKKRSIVLGKEIIVLASSPYSAKAIDIDEQAQLLVQTENGTIKTISSGEISIRLQQ